MLSDHSDRYPIRLAAEVSNVGPGGINVVAVEAACGIHQRPFEEGT
jgi:hypothetical protein